MSVLEYARSRACALVIGTVGIVCACAIAAVCGCPAEDVGRVLERGFTGVRGREGTASTGMGLYLAARLCEQLGMWLSISSVEGEGTRAALSFPLDRRRLDVQDGRE